ncbi:MAG: DUF2268 domain-containing protein [Anaerolineae bacterium]|nr:DUF2268 domain-containing protein [Anaerolineae bacterium]
MGRKRWWVLGVLVMVVLLSACGGGEDSTPELASPPTRTPAPPTETPAPEDALGQLEVVSLRASMLEFFEGTADVGALEYSIVFDRIVPVQHPECANSGFYPGFQLVSLLDGYGLEMVSVDLDAWYTVVEAFDDAVFEAGLREVLERTVEAVPMTQPVRFCVMPVPPRQNREGEIFDIFVADSIDRGVIIVACSNAAYCVETMGGQVVYEYHYNYQLMNAEYDIAAMPLMDMAIFLARADDLALTLYPDTQFPWHIELDPAEELDIWDQMQQYAATTYADYPDNYKIDRLLYGQGTGMYVDWGGMDVARQVIAAFHAQNPGVTYAALANMASQDVVQDSGYVPE